MNIAQTVRAYDLRCLQALGTSDDNAALDASRHFLAKMYDPKGKFKAAHNSLNNLRFRLAAKRTVPIARLPPSEASFKQNVKRASWQTKIWTTTHAANPRVPGPADHQSRRFVRWNNRS